MNKKLIVSNALLIVLTVFQLSGFAQNRNVAAGIVFNDLNNNGILDANEPGIADVLVSNQLEVVKTDSVGRYSLLLTERSLIFVSKPSGYNIPLNENNLPQYYYIHQPAGSPEGLDFKGIEPTEPLPESLNFPGQHIPSVQFSG